MITKQNKLDKRTKLSRYLRENKQFLRIAITLAVLFGLIATPTIYKWLNPPMLDPKGTVIDIKPIEVKAIEIKCDYDPITYLRCKGQKLGIKDTEITKIISTMKCESGLIPDAINKNKNGTFDVGIGQINDVHSKRISRQDRMDFVKNIDFIYTLYQEQGLRPWVCAKKLGFIK